MVSKLHSGEAEIDAVLVRRLVAGQFPEWAGLPVRREPAASTVNAIYRLGADMGVRLPRIHWWADDLRRELAILPRLAGRLPLAVPEPVAHGRPAEGFPFDWAIFKWLPGEPWKDELVTDVVQATRDLAAFVVALQRLDTTDAPTTRRGSPLGIQDDETRRAIRALGDSVDSTLVTALWDEALDLPQWERSPVWLHGDLLPTNILVRAGRIGAVIDFGLAGVGDPACDMIPAWCVVPRPERELYRSAVGSDEATWLRGRGWALSIALQIIPYYARSSPGFAALGRQMLDEVLADARQATQGG